MLYLDDKNLRQAGVSWVESVNVIEDVVRCMQRKDYSQPIKPYLRYKNVNNRIIAMPAYVGGNINIAGIKWIASFPDNLKINLPRAHCVVILNDEATGVPVSIINTPLISSIRTASVSGLVLRQYINNRKNDQFNVGIIGWGPIGRNHFNLCNDMFGGKILKYYLFDMNGVDVDSIPIQYREKVKIADNWEEVFTNSNIFITCTVSKNRYVNMKPIQGTLYLNVSLRDFTEDFYEYIKNHLIVDDWDEVCRENTDVEMFHLQKGLMKNNVKTIIDVVCNDYFSKINMRESVMFNPMGMSVFDIAIANLYYQKCKELDVGNKL